MSLMRPVVPQAKSPQQRTRRAILLAVLLSVLNSTPLPAGPPRKDTSRTTPNPTPSPFPNPTQQKTDRQNKKQRTTKAERHGRDMLVIDDKWQTLPAPTAETEAAGWEKAVPQEAKDTLVPSLQPPLEAGGSNKRAIAWYWRRFDLPDNWKGQTIRLRFEAVAENAEIWLNGQKVGEHGGGATPFEFIVTSQAQVGATNLLAVRVTGGKWGIGLWQGVMLLAHDEAYLGECVPQTDAQGHLNGALDLFNTSQITGDATLDARIVPAKDNNRVVAKTNQNLHLTPGRNITTLLLTIPKRQTTLWTPTNPSLYLLQLSFRQDKDVLDTQQTTFGLREFGYQNGAITLNGAPLAIKAVPATGSGLTVVATVEDQNRLRAALRRLKENDANLLYLNAPPPTMLRIADEEGIMVIEGPRTGQSATATTAELQGLIVRDRAHPCILAWNMPEVDPTAVSTLRNLDPTRFLLVGTGTAARLWVPNENGPTTGPLPTGLAIGATR